MIESARVGWWRAAAVLVVIAALATTADNAFSSAACTNSTQCGCTNLSDCTAPDQGGQCLNGTCQCNPGYYGLYCEPRGACCGVSTCAQGGPGFAAICVGSGAPCSDPISEAECVGLNGTYAGTGTTCAEGACDDTPTPTATPTSTPTSTPTRVPQGGECTDAAECATEFCEQGFCCNTACDGPLVSCGQPGQQGICAAIVAPAPAASGGGLAAMVAALGLIGLVAMYLRRRA